MLTHRQSVSIQLYLSQAGYARFDRAADSQLTALVMMRWLRDAIISSMNIAAGDLKGHLTLVFTVPNFSTTRIASIAPVKWRKK